MTTKSLKTSLELTDIPLFMSLTHASLWTGKAVHNKTPAVQKNKTKKTLLHGWWLLKSTSRICTTGQMFCALNYSGKIARTTYWCKKGTASRNQNIPIGKYSRRSIMIWACFVCANPTYFAGRKHGLFSGYFSSKSSSPKTCIFGGLATLNCLQV